MIAGQIFPTRKGARDAGSQNEKVNNIILYQGITYSSLEHNGGLFLLVFFHQKETDTVVCPHSTSEEKILESLHLHNVFKSSVSHTEK